MEVLAFLFLFILWAVYAFRIKIKVLYIIVVTFLTMALFCICHSLLMAFKDLDFSLEWLGINFLFPIIIMVFPIMFSVIIFKTLLKKYVVFKNAVLRLSIQSLAIFFIIQAGLFCWAILDMEFLDFDYEYTLPKILKAYRFYLDFVAVSFLVPVSIIYLDSWYEKRWGGNKSAVIPVDKSDAGNKS